MTCVKCIVDSWQKINNNCSSISSYQQGGPQLPWSCTKHYKWHSMQTVPQAIPLLSLHISIGGPLFQLAHLYHFYPPHFSWCGPCLLHLSYSRWWVRLYWINSVLKNGVRYNFLMATHISRLAPSKENAPSMHEGDNEHDLYGAPIQCVCGFYISYLSCKHKHKSNIIYFHFTTHIK